MQTKYKRLKPLKAETLEERITRRTGYYMQMVHDHGAEAAIRTLVEIVDALRRSKCSYPRCPDDKVI
jgi:molecular chaperone GrpE (heat shock protein)